jgi:hypothetical protein
MQETSNLPQNPPLQQTAVIRWPDSVRLKMIEKSEFYREPKVYQYGYYDGYQLQNEKIDKAIKLIQKARSNNGDDAMLQDAIISLLG